MKIVSTNIAKPTKFIWNGKTITTGIYKKPIEKPIYLGKSNVENDEVSDRKVHGGEFKACYLFSADHYPYWKLLYPNLEWDFGMLGENLTVEGLNESNITVGDIYEIGNSLVQITQPREPCFKFAHKFGTEHVLRQFIEHGFPGTYVRVLEEGFVKTGDTFALVDKAKNSITTHRLFDLLYSEKKNKSHLELMIKNNALPENLKQRLKFFLK